MSRRGRARQGVVLLVAATACVATLAGWLVFSHAPDRWALMGIVVIVVCGMAGTRLPGPKKAGLPESEPSL